jgi:DNA polymerase elongation subunit (family B)
MKVRQPRILIFDIETSPNEGYTWGKWEQNVIKFKKEWEMLSFAYKWLGESEITCVTQQKNRDDRQLIKKLHRLIASADIVVAHNGDKFDVRKSNTRIIKHGFLPPKMPATVDTLKIARRYFAFNGNSLAELADSLGLGKKFKHPGFEMWLGCMAGNAKSWRQMEFYNKKDVVLLEKVYKRFLPWIKNHPNVAKIRNPDERRLSVCPACGSDDTIKDGFAYSASTVKQEWKCKGCGHSFKTRRVA